MVWLDRPLRTCLWRRAAEDRAAGREKSGHLGACRDEGRGAKGRAAEERRAQQCFQEREER